MKGQDFRVFVHVCFWFSLVLLNLRSLELKQRRGNRCGADRNTILRPPEREPTSLQRFLTLFFGTSIAHGVVASQARMSRSSYNCEA